MLLLLLYQGSSLRRLNSYSLGEAHYTSIWHPETIVRSKNSQKTSGFNVSFRTVHWTRIGHASLTVGVCFYLVERSRSARRKEPRRACSEQAALKLEVYTASSARLNLTQEPQRMCPRTTLFSARTPNVARARKTSKPLKRKKSPKIGYVQIKP